MYKAACKRAQQLPTLLRQRCWELLCACWQWCANGCNNSQQVWDLQCIVGRIQPISVCNPSNNMQQGVQTDATRNIQQCWELLANNVASVCTGLNKTIIRFGFCDIRKIKVSIGTCFRPRPSTWLMALSSTLVPVLFLIMQSGSSYLCFKERVSI